MLQLETVEKLQLGHTDKDEIKKLFGNPDNIFNLEQFSETNETGEIWEFNENSYPRLSIYFEKESTLTHSITWGVRSGDPEQDLHTAKARYKTANWEARSAPFSNPHKTPDECYYEDRKMGISIEFRKTRKEVSSISWWNPTRVPANSDIQKKGQKFCIGSHCTHGSPPPWDGPLCDSP